MAAPSYSFENYFYTGEPALDLQTKIEARLSDAGWVFVEQVTFTQSAVSRLIRVWQCPAALNAAGADFFVGLIRNTASGQLYFAIRTFEAWNTSTKAMIRATYGGAGNAAGYFGQITYANGTWMIPVFGVVSQSYLGHTILTSTDGLTWTARRLPVTNNWSIAQYGNGSWVAIGGYYNGSGSSTYGSSTIAATSTDNGVTWTQRTMPSGQWTDLVWGSTPALWVAIGAGSVWATSPDGITWTQRTAPTSGSWSAITYGNGTYVAVTYTSTTSCYTSTNGTTWTARSLGPSSVQWTDVAYGNGMFVALSVGGNTSYSTDSGVTWTYKATTISSGGGSWQSMTYGDSGFLAVNNGNTATTRGWAYSTDGITWVNGNSLYDTGVNYGTSVAFGGSQYIFTSGSPNTNNVQLASITDVALGKPVPYGLSPLAPFAPGEYQLNTVLPTSTAGSTISNIQPAETFITFSATTSYDIAILASKSYLAVAVNTNGTGTNVFQCVAGLFAPNYTDSVTANPPLWQTNGGSGMYATSRSMRALPDAANQYTFGGQMNPDGLLAGLHTNAAKEQVGQSIRATRIALTTFDLSLAFVGNPGGAFRGWMYDCVAVAVTSASVLKVGDTVTLGATTYTAIGTGRSSNNGVYWGLFFNTAAGS